MNEEVQGLATNLIAEDRLKRVLESELIVLRERQAWAIVDELIRIFRERNFMLGYVGDRQYSFVHRTFLEYFLAREIRRRFDSGELVEEGLLAIFLDHSTQDEWHQVLLLLCGLLEPDAVARIVRQVLSRAHGPHRFEFVFLAAQCLKEARSSDVIIELREGVRDRLMYMKEMFWEASQLSSAHVETDYQFRGRVLEELAVGWQDDPSILALLKRRAESESSAYVRKTAIGAVASNWRNRAETRAWLMSRAEEDVDSTVRTKALIEALRASGRNMSACEWLKQRGESDPDRGVRRTAIKELSRLRDDDPAVTSWMEQRAATDPDGLVRYTLRNEVSLREADGDGT